MSETLQTNIFFLITSIAVVTATVFVCVVLYYIVRIIRRVDHIVKRVDERSEVIANDLARARAYVVQGKLLREVGMTLGRIFHTSSRGVKRQDDQESA